MSNTIKTGLSSFGMSSIVFHGPLLKVHQGFEIVKIVERHKRDSKNYYPEASIVTSFDELCNDPEIELIIVNVPDALHYSFAKQALTSGKNVIVEKPFTLKYSDAIDLINTAKKHNKLLSVFQNRRWDGDFMTLKQVIENELTGRLVDFESHFDRYRNYIQPFTWKEQVESGTGTLFNLGSHMIDQAILLFGMPEAVKADIRINRTGGAVDDSFDLLLRKPDLRINIRGSYLVREQGPRYILHGTEGSFLKWGIDPQEAALKMGELPGKAGWGEESEDSWGILNTQIDGLHYKGKIETIAGNYLGYYDNIFQCLRSEALLEVKPEEAAEVIRIIEVAKESNDKRREIEL